MSGREELGRPTPVPNVRVFLYIEYWTQEGGIVTIVFAVAGYFAIVGICVRFFQFAHERDQAMRLITNGWIQNESGVME
jgi:hypothetical protein